MNKEVLRWLNYLAVLAGIAAIAILGYGIIRTLI